MREIFLKFFDKTGEKTILTRFLKDCAPQGTTSLRVLDIGCGYGKYLKHFKKLGFNISGIDANQLAVDDNKQRGLECYHVSERSQLPDGSFDVLLMSHIVEHFEPNDLLQFVESYLPLLKKNGHVLVCTPLMSEFFYNDFDHIKPYHPYSFITMFDKPDGQVQYLSKHQLKLVDLSYRKHPFRLTHVRGLYVRSWSTPLIRLFNVAMGLVCLFSGRLIGFKNGWVGRFQYLK